MHVLHHRNARCGWQSHRPLHRRRCIGGLENVVEEAVLVSSSTVSKVVAPEVPVGPAVRPVVPDQVVGPVGAEEVSCVVVSSWTVSSDSVSEYSDVAWKPSPFQRSVWPLLDCEPPSQQALSQAFAFSLVRDWHQTSFSQAR